ncbi:tetratricopeptide repeat protein [Streptosporangium sp. G12]
MSNPAPSTTWPRPVFTCWALYTPQPHAGSFLTLAMESGHPQAAPKGAFNLGGLLAGEGHAEEAMRALQRAVDSGHPDESPGALTQLGALWFTAGRVADAEAAFERVIATRHPEFAPMAHTCLMDSRRQRG